MVITKRMLNEMTACRETQSLGYPTPFVFKRVYKYEYLCKFTDRKITQFKKLCSFYNNIKRPTY